MKSIDRTYFRVAGVVWALCFVVFLLAYMLVLRPQEQRLSRIKSKAAESQRQAEAAKEAAADETRETLNEQIQNLQEQLRSFVVASGKIQDVGGQIRNIFVEAGLDLSSLNMDLQSSRSISTFSDCKYVYGHPISLEFPASFNKFATFINALERNEPVVFINTFSIEKSSEDSDHKVTMELAVLVDK